MKCFYACLFLGCLLAASPAAAEMKLGGYVAAPEVEDEPSALDAPGLPLPDTAAMTLRFTPRASGTLYGGSAVGDDGALELSMGLDEHWASAQRLDAMGFDYDREDKSEMMVGGALLLEDVRLTGGLGRTKLFGTTADLLAAGFTYGPLSARVLLGEGRPEEAVERDIMVFSTDIAPYSWLSLQGDVALTDDEGAPPQAVGRLGIQLRF